MYVFPTLLLTHPRIASGSILEYRLARTKEALKKAESKRYHGMMFPWESGSSGSETSPNSLYSDFEHHVVGDVGFAFKQYWHATRDLDWLAGRNQQHHGSVAAPYRLIEGVANFFASRAEKTGSVYSIKKVVPPDEYRGVCID
eukprot:GEZU01006482.1.p1 GENE.GEZU01006482.1~~GEZU01006482.1.p1  ORF type:complete len:143 (-),score=21.49 GEZU01006482.1:190-618(-)